MNLQAERSQLLIETPPQTRLKRQYSLPLEQKRTLGPITRRNTATCVMRADCARCYCSYSPHMLEKAKPTSRMHGLIATREHELWRRLMYRPHPPPPYASTP